MGITCALTFFSPFCSSSAVVRFLANCTQDTDCNLRIQTNAFCGPYDMKFVVWAELQQAIRPVYAGQRADFPKFREKSAVLRVKS